MAGGVGKAEGLLQSSSVNCSKSHFCSPSLDKVSPQNPACPSCGFKKSFRAGIREIYNFKIQRWHCKNCGLRFSDPEQLKAFREFSVNLKKKCNVDSNSRLCVLEEKAEKLVFPEQIQALEKKAENGAIVQFAWRMRQEGFAYDTIRTNGSCLKGLIQRGANLDDVENVKEVLANEKTWSSSRKRNAISAYTLYLRFKGLSWTKPKCKVTTKFPFIPTEKEIDDLIAGSGKKNAAFLQLIKETAMRSGEAKRLLWINIDREKSVITLNDPEKGSNPRMWKVSGLLIEMLNALPRNTEQVFTGSLRAMKTTFVKTRIRLATNLQNPRLPRIHFHTLRHWKGTMLYHQTKDPYYVQKFLGHVSLKSTEIYINIEHALFTESPDDKFIIKAINSVKEATELGEQGFEPFMVIEGVQLMRKRR